MKLTIKNIISTVLAVCLMLTVCGCGGATVEEYSVWEEGEDTTQTIVHSSVIQGTSDSDDSSGTKDKTDTDSKNNADKDVDNKSDADNNNSDKSNSDKKDDGKTVADDTDSKKDDGKTDANKGNDKADNNKNTVDKDGLSNQTSVDTDTDGKDLDLGGREIVLASWGDGYEPNPSSGTYNEEIKLIADIEKKYNCKIKYKTVYDSMGYLSAWTAAAQAGTPFGDIVTLASSWAYPQQMNLGYLTALDELIDIEDPIFNSEAVEQLKTGGKHYGVVLASRFKTPSVMIFNKAVIDKFGVNNPHDLVSQNNWNWDSFLEIARKCTAVDNGIQYYGFAMSGADADKFGKTNSGNAIIKGSKGKKTYNPDANYIEGVQLAYDLYNTYKVTPAFGQQHTAFESGRAAMIISESYKLPTYYEQLGTKNIYATYLPIGRKANDYICTLDETTMYAIPSTTKDAEIVAQLMYDFIYPYKWKGSEREDVENYIADSTSAKIVLDMGDRANANLTLGPLYTYISRTIGWGTYGIDKQQSPQAYFDTVKAAAQAELDTIWDQ